MGAFHSYNGPIFHPYVDTMHWCWGQKFRTPGLSLLEVKIWQSLPVSLHNAFQKGPNTPVCVCSFICLVHMTVDRYDCEEMSPQSKYYYKNIEPNKIKVMAIHQPMTSILQSAWIWTPQHELYICSSNDTDLTVQVSIIAYTVDCR